MTKTSFNTKAPFTNKFDLNLRKNVVKCYIRSTAVCGAVTSTVLH